LSSGQNRWLGVLYDAETFRPITEFSAPARIRGIAFNPGRALLATIPYGEVVSFVPVAVAEVLAGAAVCGPGSEQETDVTLACTLHGEANPEGVSETEVWFGWGMTPVLGSMTPAQPVATGGVLVPASARIEARPNETVYYRLEGRDRNVKAPEALGSETASFTTPAVAPRVPGEPAVSFVGSASAVMSGELNPENANTSYRFQYGACATLEACPGTGVTPVAEAASYGKLATTLEASGLQPGTVYRYRLVAESAGGVAHGAEGQFATAPAPAVGAVTGAASGVGVGGATISGLASPDGKPAVYTFELGVANGAATQYGIVFSGPVAASVAPVPEAYALSGLQPGVTYAYRIAVHSGYGTALGETATFTTQGLPAVLLSPTAPALLAVPPIVFPAVESQPLVKAKPKKPKPKPAKKTKKRGKRKARKARARKATARKTTRN